MLFIVLAARYEFVRTDRARSVPRRLPHRRPAVTPGARARHRALSGRPCSAIGAVVVLGATAALVTVAYIRLTGGPGRD